MPELVANVKIYEWPVDDIENRASYPSSLIYLCARRYCLHEPDNLTSLDTRPGDGSVYRGRDVCDAPHRSRQNQVSRDAAIVPPPEVQWIYDTAPVGLACLSTDCRYVL